MVGASIFSVCGLSSRCRLRSFGATGISLTLSVFLLGCDSKPRNDGQVAAEVNGSEITVHEVNRQLINVSNAGDADLPAIKREIIDDLIDRKLLAQGAASAKLDRDPDVMRAISEARETILGEAFIARRLAARPAPTAGEIQSFLSAHPELFQQRRIYTLRQFTIAAENLDKHLAERFGTARSANDIEQILKAGNIAYQEQVINKAAEQLPMELAARLMSTARGDVVTFSMEDEAQVTLVEDFRSEPIEGPEAEENVQRYLINTDRQRSMEAAIEEFRKTAKINYLGEYATLPAAREPPPSGSIAPASENGDDRSGQLPAHVERGVSGLVK
jgi:EpsD family peptidyl-prolyl cis-trans isomerase